MRMDEIKDLNPEWTERLGHKIIGKNSIIFVPMETVYDNLEKTNIFSISLNLDSSTTSEKEKSGKVEEGKSKKKVKDIQL